MLAVQNQTDTQGWIQGEGCHGSWGAQIIVLWQQMITS